MARTVPAKERRQLPGPERRKQILAVARRAFVSSGLAGARIQQIADMAGCNEAVIYHYFSSKQQLFEVSVLEPLQEMMVDFEADAERIASEADDPAAAVREGLSHLIRTMKEIAPLLGLVLFGQNEQGKRFYRDHFSPLISRSLEVSWRAVGNLRDEPLDPIFGPGVMGIGIGVVMDHLLRGAKLDERHVTEVLTELLLHGLPSPERHPGKGNRKAQQKASNDHRVSAVTPKKTATGRAVATVEPSSAQLSGRRQQILQVAREAFMTSGFAGARIQQIADMAGCNEALIYHYFDSKRQLFEAAILDPLHQLMGDFSQTAVTMGGDASEDHRTARREAILHLLLGLEEILPVLGLALFGEQKAGQRFYREHVATSVVSGLSVLLGGRSDAVVDSAVFGMAFAVVMDRWFRDAEFDNDHAADVLTQFLHSGLDLRALAPRLEPGSVPTTPSRTRRRKALQPTGKPEAKSALRSMAQASPSQLPAAERRRQILTLAREAFITSGFAGTGIRQIADKAGCDPALMYRYFASKQELFEAAVFQPIERMLMEFSRAGPWISPQGTEDRASAMRTGLCDLIRSMDAILPLLGLVLFSEREQAKYFYQTRFPPFALSGLLGSSRDSVVGPATFGMVFGVVMDTWFRDVTLDAEGTAGALTEFLLSGLALRGSESGLDAATRRRRSKVARSSADKRARASEESASSSDESRVLSGLERRHQILTAARQAFTLSGLAGTGIRQIAELADCNEALIYRYFDSKQQLFEVSVLEPLQEMMVDFEADAERIASEADDPAAAVREGLSHLIRTMKEIAPLLGLVLFGQNEQGKRFYRDHFSPLISRSLEVSWRAVGNLRDEPLDPIFGPGLFGMGNGVVMDHFLRGAKLDESHVTEVLTELLLHGVPEQKQRVR